MPRSRRRIQPIKRRRSSTTRKRYKRKSYKRARSRRMTLPRQMFPAKLVAKHRYICAGTQSVSTSGAVSNVIFRANSLFDPEYALGGHQPRNFDQIMPFYNHYTVTGAKITVKLYKNWSGGGFTTTDTDPTIVSLFLKADHTSPSQDLMIGRETCDHASITLSDNDGHHHLSKSFSASRFFGKARSNVNAESELSGSASSSPTEQAYFILSFQDLEAMQGETDSLYPIHYEVKIDYTATYTERNAIGES